MYINVCPLTADSSSVILKQKFSDLVDPDTEDQAPQKTAEDLLHGTPKQQF